MALVFNGTTNVISGVAVGGLPDDIVDTVMLAANAVSSAKLASGAGGKVVQVKQGVITTSSSTSSGSFQSTGLSEGITMTAASNKVLVFATGSLTNSSSGSGGAVTIFRGSTNLAPGGASSDGISMFYAEDNSNNIENAANLLILDAPGAGTHTYEVKVRAFNGTQGFGNRKTGVLVLVELAF